MTPEGGDGNFFAESDGIGRQHVVVGWHAGKR
jgi:hypothetical protein